MVVGGGGGGGACEWPIKLIAPISGNHDEKVAIRPERDARRAVAQGIYSVK